MDFEDWMYALFGIAVIVFVIGCALLPIALVIKVFFF